MEFDDILMFKNNEKIVKHEDGDWVEELYLSVF